MRQIGVLMIQQILRSHDILTGEITVKGSSDFKKKSIETLNILKTKIELDVVSIK